MIDPNAFAGWMRRVSVYGVAAAAIKIQCGLAAEDQVSGDPERARCATCRGRYWARRRGAALDGRHSVQVSISAKLRAPAGFATMLIS